MEELGKNISICSPFPWKHNFNFLVSSDDDFVSKKAEQKARVRPARCLPSPGAI